MKVAEPDNDVPLEHRNKATGKQMNHDSKHIKTIL